MSASPNQPIERPEKLEADFSRTRSKPLGFVSATTIVAASMIGAGVYTTSGFTIGDLGAPGWVVLAWIVAGAIAISGAICYGALAKEFTDSGGEYLFLSRVVHPIAGLMAGWVSLLAGFTGAIAFAATAFAEYLLPAEPSLHNWIGIALILICAMVHSIGVRPGAFLQNTVVILKIVLIVGFIVFAMMFVDDWPRRGLPIDAHQLKTQVPSGFALVSTFATALMWISLSYSGFNAAVYVAGEVNQPDRNVPRALFWGTCLVTLIYVALNAIFVYAPDPESIRYQSQIATIAADAISGERFSLFVRVVILIGLFTSVSALVMTGPRVYAKMADDGFLPKLFRFQGSIPVASIWIQAALACVVVYISTLKDLLDYLGFTLSVSAALTASLVFWLHRKKSSSVQVALYPIPPIIFVCGTLLTATLAAIASPMKALVGILTLVFGLVFYPWYRSRNSDPQRSIDHIHE